MVYIYKKTRVFRGYIMEKMWPDNVRIPSSKTNELRVDREINRRIDKIGKFDYLGDFFLFFMRFFPHDIPDIIFHFITGGIGSIFLDTLFFLFFF
jgi:hypothetical protein